MLADKAKLSRLIAWTLLGLVSVLAFLAWASGFNWRFNNLTSYSLFPLFGLLAWSIMWTHYAYGSIVLSTHLPKDHTFKSASQYLVLGLIIAHPGLLTFSLWRDTKKLPPGSVYSYVGPTLHFAVFLGLVALITFLSYEFFDHLRDKQWVKKYWGLISLSQMLAMALIFIHSMKLGTNLQTGWFKYYWITLGVLLLPCFYIIGRHDWSKK